MAVLGNKRKVFIKASAQGTYGWLVGEQSNSININNNLIEVSDKSTRWQDFIAGTIGATAEINVYADSTSSEQQAIMSALVAGSKVYVAIAEVDGTTAPTSPDYEFVAQVGSVGETNDNGSVSTRNISLTACGEVDMN